jgi:CheY-like chemotaxis protein
VETRWTILLVDDDDDTRTCVKSVLEGEGYKVLSARNGREALDELARSEAPALVLLDLMMPVMSGWEVLEAIEAVPRLRALPIVVFTAAGEPAARERAIGRPVLRKPIDLDLLLQMVHKFCATARTVIEPPSDLLPKGP